ncbi:hypothetical protein HC891_18800 [Candidatus Gracilibacteria bacterium]|nr:hypothetical protein [Candidatus Gracilibacteria bacterium]
MNFVSQASIDIGNYARLGLQRRGVGVRGCRTIGKADLVRNNATPQITVNPDTYEVFVDGELATCEPAERLPLTQLYFIVGTPTLLTTQHRCSPRSNLATPSSLRACSRSRTVWSSLLRAGCAMRQS